LAARRKAGRRKKSAMRIRSEYQAVDEIVDAVARLIREIHAAMSKGDTVFT
jgi:hypothetical protein